MVLAVHGPHVSTRDATKEGQGHEGHPRFAPSSGTDVRHPRGALTWCTTVVLNLIDGKPQRGEGAVWEVPDRLDFPGDEDAVHGAVVAALAVPAFVRYRVTRL